MAEIDKTQETEPDNNQNTNQNSEPDGKAKEKEDQASGAKYTDEDVDKLINRKFAEWQKKQEKAVDEAKRLAEMNEQEKTDYKFHCLHRRSSAESTRMYLQDSFKSSSAPVNTKLEGSCGQRAAGYKDRSPWIPTKKAA